MKVAEAHIFVLTVLLLQKAEASQRSRATYPLVVIKGDGPNTCPSMGVRETAIQSIRNDIERNLTTAVHCGNGFWYQVAYLNMTDPQQNCPSAWRQYTSNSARVCGRQTSSSGSCSAILYTTDRSYSKVCGRIIGYQVATTDAFSNDYNTIDINSVYVDGISVTRGQPRNHIWTFAAGVTENSNRHAGYNCPCHDSTATQPPTFVGDNYYCESGNPSNVWTGALDSGDKLWDGEQCDNEGSCCTGPPWFSVDLGINSTDSIEVRICGSEGTMNEDTPIELLEIYIQ